MYNEQRYGEKKISKPYNPEDFFNGA